MALDGEQPLGLDPPHLHPNLPDADLRQPLCYRRLVQDTVITAERRTLLFGSRDDPRDMNPIELDPESDTLLLGCYGRFVAEERACRRAEQESISEECFTDHEPEA